MTAMNNLVFGHANGGGGFRPSPRAPTSPPETAAEAKERMRFRREEAAASEARAKLEEQRRREKKAREREEGTVSVLYEVNRN